MSSNSTKVSLWKLECSVVYETQFWVGLVKRKGCHRKARIWARLVSRLWICDCPECFSPHYTSCLTLFSVDNSRLAQPGGQAWIVPEVGGVHLQNVSWKWERETQTVACWPSFIEPGWPSLTIHVRSSLTSFKTSTLICIKHFPDKKSLTNPLIFSLSP